MTNHHDDELGRLITREMHRRTDELHDTPLMFHDVRGKAVSIRRRRRVATGVGVAAAIAVIVPTAMFATKGLNSDTVQPATTVPSVTTPSPSDTPSPSSTPVTGPRPHALDFRDLPTGAPPAVDYLTKDDASPLPFSYVKTGEVTVQVVSDGVAVDGNGQSWEYTGASAAARNA